MKPEYDFTHARRGPVLPVDKNKVRITIRIDGDIIDWFRQEVDSRGGGNYQSLINEALRAHVQQKQQPLEEMLRRVVREELERQ
jgi:uncharacterized protein (DUF4415 family)